MATALQRPPNGAIVARKAREQFVAAAQACLGPMGVQIRNRLLELAQTPAGAREMQERRDAMMDFDKKGAAFMQGVAKAWQKAVEPPTATTRARLDGLRVRSTDLAAGGRRADAQDRAPSRFGARRRHLPRR